MRVLLYVFGGIALLLYLFVGFAIGMSPKGTSSIIWHRIIGLIGSFMIIGGIIWKILS